MILRSKTLMERIASHPYVQDFKVEGENARWRYNFKVTLFPSTGDSPLRVGSDSRRLALRIIARRLGIIV